MYFICTLMINITHDIPFNSISKFLDTFSPKHFILITKYIIIILKIKVKCSICVLGKKYYQILTNITKKILPKINECYQKNIINGNMFMKL